MSNENEPSLPSAVPAAAQKELAVLDEETQAKLLARTNEMRENLSKPDSNVIKTAGKVFTLPDGTSSPGPLYAIILDFVWDFRYFSTAFTPGQPSPPACWAIGRRNAESGKLAPDPDKVPTPVAANCGVCPMNKWGSKGRGKACKNQRRLLVANPDNIQGEPMTLYVSPKAIKNFDNYIAKLLTVHGLQSPTQVITKIFFDSTVTYPCLKFDMEGPYGNVNAALSVADAYESLLFSGPEQTDS